MCIVYLRSTRINFLKLLTNFVGHTTILQYELRTRSKTVHHVLGIGFVFLGPSDRAPGKTQQEWEFGCHEELQLGQYVKSRLSTHTGRNLQHETADAPKPHTICHVFLGQQSTVRGVSPDGIWVMSRFIKKPLCRRTTGNSDSFHTQRCPTGTRVHTLQRSYTQVCNVFKLCRIIQFIIYNLFPPE